MAKHIHLFNTVADFTGEYDGSGYVEPWVSYTEEDEAVNYNKPPQTPFVDLGLPSGTLWADRNVGAAAPEDSGFYFAWGETEPDKASAYTGENYKWPQYEKYNNTDGLTVLEPADDAAYVIMGDPWRLPTREQATEMLQKCSVAQDILNGVSGWTFTSSINGNTIFFPGTGSYTEDGFQASSMMRLWLSTAGTAWGSGYYMNGGWYGMMGPNKYLARNMRIHGFVTRGVRLSE